MDKIREQSGKLRMPMLTSISLNSFLSRRRVFSLVSASCMIDITGMATPFMHIIAYMPNKMYAIGDKHFSLPTSFSMIESMADHYITLVKSIQPQGPYIVTGYSFGGRMAISMADKLTRAGETA